MAGQHDGSVISCVGTDRDLRLYVRSVASWLRSYVLEMSFQPGPLVRKHQPPIDAQISSNRQL